MGAPRHCPATGSEGTTAARLGSCQPAVSARAQAPLQQRRGPPLDQGGTHVEAHARARAGRHAGGPELGDGRRRPGAVPQPERGHPGVPGRRAGLDGSAGQPRPGRPAVPGGRAGLDGPVGQQRPGHPAVPGGRAGLDRSAHLGAGHPAGAGQQRGYYCASTHPVAAPAQVARTASPTPPSSCSSPWAPPPRWPSAWTRCPSAARPARRPTRPSDHPHPPDPMGLPHHPAAPSPFPFGVLSGCWRAIQTVWTRCIT